MREMQFDNLYAQGPVVMNGGIPDALLPFALSGRAGAARPARSGPTALATMRRTSCGTRGCQSNLTVCGGAPKLRITGRRSAAPREGSARALSRGPPRDDLGLDRSYKSMQGAPCRAQRGRRGLGGAARTGTRSRGPSRAPSTSSRTGQRTPARSAGTPLPLGRASWSVQQRTRRRPTAVASGDRGWPRYRHLVGTYAWYAVPWSSCLEGKIISRGVGHRGHRRGRAGAAGHHDLQRADIVGPRPAERAGEGCQPLRSFST